MDQGQLTTQLNNPAETLLSLLAQHNGSQPSDWDRTMTALSEITNGYGKDLMAPLDRASSGSLPHRAINSAASGSDVLDASDKAAPPHAEPAEPAGRKQLPAGSHQPRESTPAASVVPSADKPIAPALPLQQAAPLSSHPSAAVRDANAGPATSANPSKVAVQGPELATVAQPGQQAGKGEPHAAAAAQPGNVVARPNAIRPHQFLKPDGTTAALTVKATGPRSEYTQHPAFRLQAKPRLQPLSQQPVVNTTEASSTQANPKPVKTPVKSRPAVNSQHGLLHHASAKGTNPGSDTARLQDISTAAAPSREQPTVEMHPAVASQGANRPAVSPRHRAAAAAAAAAAPRAGTIAARAGAALKPYEPNGWELQPGFQPPLSALPDDIAAWDTPRLEQMPGRLPEPRFNSHLLLSGQKAAGSARTADQADSASDSPRVVPPKKGEAVIVEDSTDGQWPAHVLVQCNGNQGKFLLVKQSMVCTCKLCQNKAAKLGVPFVDMTPTEFERHSGMAASKKWKYTVRIQHDGRPIGTWLEIHGYAPKTLTRDRSLPADGKMATRDRNRPRDRSKSSDLSGDAPSSGTAPGAGGRPEGKAVPAALHRLAGDAALAQAAEGRAVPAGPHRLAGDTEGRAAPGSPDRLASTDHFPDPLLATAPADHFPEPLHATAPADPEAAAAADLLMAAAAAVNRAEALQRAEASESDASPRSWQRHGSNPFSDVRRQRDKALPERRGKRDRAGVTQPDGLVVRPEEGGSPVEGQEAAPGGAADRAEAGAVPEVRKVRGRKAVAKPSLRESAAHQAVLPDRVGTPPAPQGGALRWAPGPSFDEALESAKGPEKAAADLLPLDATFDPETHEGAALSTQAGRNQRALPDKRARRKPGWLDNTIDPKTAAQLALYHPTAEGDAQSDGEANDSGNGNGVNSNPELRWSHQRRLRNPGLARKRDRPDDTDDLDMGDDSEWRGPGRLGKRNCPTREPEQAWAAAGLLHSGSNVPQRLRTLPRGNSSFASNADARAELEAVATLGSMHPQILDWQPVSDMYLQVSVKFRGRTFKGVVNVEPEEPSAPATRSSFRHLNSAYVDTAAGESETFSPKARRGSKSPHKTNAAGFDDLDSATHSPMGPPSGHDRGPHGPSRFASRRFQTAPATSPEQPDTYSGAQFTPPSARNNHYEDGEVQSSSRRQTNSAEPAHSADAVATTERRATVDREYARLELQGAPEGTKCALCHREEVDEEDSGVRQERGLGPFLLVRVSAIQYAWVHSQCALWSSEVYESEEQLEGVPDAVRRGRKLKCKECGAKGATLGCHVRNCRSSFHLPCARSGHCLLQVEPQVVTCPHHRSDRAFCNARSDPSTAAAFALYSEDQDEPNGMLALARPRTLDRSGSLQGQGSWQVEGRPIEDWEKDDDLPSPGNAEGMQNSPAFKNWLRSLGPRNFDPDAVPDSSMANFLGGTVSVAANRSGRCAVCTVQRKGKCGSLSAPTKCRRKMILAVLKKIQEEEEPWLPQPAQRRKRS